MRVAYVLGTSQGGTARHVRMLASGLARRGLSVTVYAPADTWAPAGPRAPAGTGAAEAPGRDHRPLFEAVEIADRLRPARDLAAARRLHGLLARSRPAVVHAHGLRAGALAALARPAGGGGSGPRLVVTVHNAPPAGRAVGAVYRLLEHLVARRADQVLCVSADLEERMRERGARRVARAVVPAPPAAPGTAPSAAPSGLGAADGQADAPVVLAVARLAPQKGLGTLIEAAARWRDRDPAPCLVIAGTGPLLPELTRRAQVAGVSARFLGHRDDVPALLAAADVVVLPSRWEGQPLIVQEVLRAGRPLVASRVGGIPDLTGEEAALLVPPGDPTALAAAVLKVLDDPALAMRLGEAAVKRAQALPTEQDALDAVLAVYHRLIPG